MLFSSSSYQSIFLLVSPAPHPYTLQICVLASFSLIPPKDYQDCFFFACRLIDQNLENNSIDHNFVTPEISLTCVQPPLLQCPQSGRGGRKKVLTKALSASPLPIIFDVAGNFVCVARHHLRPCRKLPITLLIHVISLCLLSCLYQLRFGYCEHISL